MEIIGIQGQVHDCGAFQAIRGARAARCRGPDATFVALIQTEARFSRKALTASLWSAVLCETARAPSHEGRRSRRQELIDADPHRRGHERLLAGDVRYRFVIDVATMPSAEGSCTGAPSDGLARRDRPLCP